VVRNRVEYLRKYLDLVYTDEKKQFVYAIILFTLFVENVSLFSQFYVVLWFNRFRESVLKDTAQQVQYTRNEEMLHAQVGIKLIQTLRDEYPELFDDELEARVMEESKVAFEAEKALITWMVGDFSEGALSASILHGFIQNRFNDSMQAIGFAAPFVADKSVAETTRWMDEESYGNNVVDFFHKRPVDYAKKNRAYKTEDLF
jgi:ribonucleoside-diphosphate reductase beta chain